MEIFNNREIAIAFWLLPLVGFVLAKKNIRKSIFQVLKAALHFKLIFPVAFFIAYIVAVVFISAEIGFWEPYLLKDSILWILFVGMALFFRFSTSDKPENLFKKVTLDSISIIVFIEFVLNTYTFTLIGELLFIPIVTFIALLNSFSKLKEEHKPVKKVTDNILSIIGLTILSVGLYKALNNYTELNSIESLKSFLLPIILTLLSFPFIYIFVLIINYEQLFLRIDLNNDERPKIKRAAKKVILKHCLFSLKKARKAKDMSLFNLMSIRNETDIKKLDETYKREL